MKTGRVFSVVLFLTSVIAASPCAAQNQATPAKLYETGNLEYQKGNYGGAEQCYRRILNSGINTGPLYYNLGNACFKQKKLGEAIYYWEKARQLMPSDKETRENLELANLMIVDRIETVPDPLLFKLTSWLVGLFTIEQESWLVLGLFIAANLLFTVCLIARKHSFHFLVTSLAVGLLFLVFCGSLWWKIYERDYRQKGIVIAQKVDVRSGPGAENITVFSVHEGIKVRVLGNTNGWTQITLPNGWNGWLPHKDIRIL
jgi:tetratricopeptide (TPR) repeat protein